MLVQNICSTKAYDIVASNDNAFLVDVRTKEEWQQVGIPCLKNKDKVIFLSWQLSPFMEINRNFEDNFLSSINDEIYAIDFLQTSANKEKFEENTSPSTAAYTEARENEGLGLTYKLPLEASYAKSLMIFFLCRSGYRSFIAANFIANMGYKNCYNISDGFEGNNQNKGWKQNNLPWQF